MMTETEKVMNLRQRILSSHDAVPPTWMCQCVRIHQWAAQACSCH